MLAPLDVAAGDRESLERLDTKSGSLVDILGPMSGAPALMIFSILTRTRARPPSPPPRCGEGAGGPSAPVSAI
jgi:hypothetical protein